MTDNLKISKFLSYVLRHKPDAIGLELDTQGWADVSELIAKAPVDFQLTTERLESIVAANDKKRFKLSPDKARIRASQGHSVDVDLRMQAKPPPATLFHGTASRFVESIVNQGLLPRQRQHVHLSDNQHTATAVGKRHGSPVIFTIDARAMAAAGYSFYQSDNGVWLTKHVPAKYLTSQAPAPSANHAER